MSGTSAMSILVVMLVEAMCGGSIQATVGQEGSGETAGE